MRPEERDLAHLWDMLEAARSVLRFTAGMTVDEFCGERSEVTRLAVERMLEILGEAARRVSVSFRESHPEIPWQSIVGLRNAISHEYDRVNHEEIFRSSETRLPELIGLLRPLVPEPPVDDE